MNFILENIQNPVSFFTLLFVSNVLMFVLNFVISFFWNKYFRFEMLAYNSKDIFLAIFVAIFINVFIAIPGYILYLNGEINFTKSHFLRDLIIVFLLIDLMMFLLHLLSHFVYPFNKMHQKHHSHKYFNTLSLYVMHPFEAIAFGLLLTIIPFLFTMNLYSFLIFLFVNWLLGVVAHLNTKSKKSPLFFANNVFHKKHHLYGNFNFGFYTVVWDRIFKTYYRK